MKKLVYSFAAVVLCSSLVTAQAQFSPGSTGPDFSGAMSKLFGETKAFSANAEIKADGIPGGGDVTMTSQLAYLEGKSRLELDMSKIQGAKISPEMVNQMKQMGMDRIVMISLPEKRAANILYPTLQAYAEIAIPNADASKNPADFNLKLTEQGKETIDGHPCVKNAAMVTDKSGKTNEFTVWNATDLKSFPIKITTTEKGMAVTILFKDLKFAKPETSQFDAPSAYKKYDSLMALMQQEMAKRMGGAPGEKR